MTTTKLDDLAKIVGQENVSDKQEILIEYSGNSGPQPTIEPLLVIWPQSADEVSKIVEWANRESIPLVPVSSGVPHLRGDSTPKVDGIVIVDLSRMDQIIRLDPKNKVVMVEPGVTYSKLIPKLTEQGLRPLMPFLPKATKSVLAVALDREPITIPRFHWDSSDPLLCTETVYGTGDLFRTGSAAGPGSIEEQWSTGQAQKNPQGPSQFDPFRLLQGSQGTMGIVTWASVKCEVLPEIHNVFLAGSDDIDSLINFSYAILRRRLLDEHMILNAASLAAAIEHDPKKITSLRDSLPEWILIVGISGHGPLAQDAYDYRYGDAMDIAMETGVSLTDNVNGVSSSVVSKLLNCSSEEPYWKLRPKGGVREVLFTTTLDRVPSLHSVLLDESEILDCTNNEVGIYIQPTVQGVNTHCTFDIYYDSNDVSDVKLVDTLVIEGSKNLLSQGAFFSRPFGPITDNVFEQASPEIVRAMKRVKKIFDPNNVLNPGTLCFKEVPK
ncbi:MAG: FAD-binding oxidoreductase [Candidatus Thorarchaeota archaeon]